VAQNIRVSPTSWRLIRRAYLLTAHEEKTLRNFFKARPLQTETIWFPYLRIKNTPLLSPQKKWRKFAITPRSASEYKIIPQPSLQLTFNLRLIQQDRNVSTFLLVIILERTECSLSWNSGPHKRKAGCPSPLLSRTWLLTPTILIQLERGSRKRTSKTTTDARLPKPIVPSSRSFWTHGTTLQILTASDDSSN